MRPEAFVKPSNPLSSNSRAVFSLHANHRHFPDGERDKVRYLDNEHSMLHEMEYRITVVNDPDLPIFIRDGTARIVLANSWVDGNKDVASENNINTFSHSIHCGSVNGELFTNIAETIPARMGECKGGHSICNMDVTTRTISVRNNKHMKMIPACTSKFVNLKELWLNDTGVKKIENLDTLVNLEKLWLSKTGVSKIENLDKNVKLKHLMLKNTGVPKEECDTFHEKRPNVTVYCG